MLRLAEIVITYVLLLITWEDLQLRFVKNFFKFPSKWGTGLINYLKNLFAKISATWILFEIVKNL